MININELIEIYQKVIEPNLKNWVVFSNGTCVIHYYTKGTLETEAKEVLQKYGSPTPGTPSADFQVMKVDSGWIVTGDQPGILNYVSEEEGKNKEDFEIGLIGRDNKEKDLKDLKIIHIQS